MLYSCTSLSLSYFPVLSYYLLPDTHPGRHVQTCMRVTPCVYYTIHLTSYMYVRLCTMERRAQHVFRTRAGSMVVYCNQSYDHYSLYRCRCTPARRAALGVSVFVSCQSCVPALSCALSPQLPSTSPRISIMVPAPACCDRERRTVPSFAGQVLFHAPELVLPRQAKGCITTDRLLGDLGPSLD